MSFPAKDLGENPCYRGVKDWRAVGCLSLGQVCIFLNVGVNLLQLSKNELTCYLTHLGKSFTGEHQ